jgi:hypothetical protein
MSIIGFCRPLLLNGMVLAGFGVGGASLLRTPAPDACALLTLAELTAAVGQPVVGANPSSTGDGGGQCMYGYGTMNQIGVELWQYPSAAAAQQRFADELKETQANTKAKTTVESGIGEGAYSATSQMGTMQAVTWGAVHGSRFFHLITLGGSQVPHDRLRALLLTALTR